MRGAGLRRERQRADRLSARKVARVDRSSASTGSSPGSTGRSRSQDVIQAVVDDIAREFEITLVSMYLPIEQGQLTMVGVAGYPSPFHVIEIGVGIIGRAAETQQTQFVPGRPRRSRLSTRHATDVRSEVAAPVVHSGELLGVVNFEGTLEHPIGRRRSRSPRCSSRRCRRPSGRPASTMSGALACTPSNASSRSAASLVADLDRPRIVASIVDAVAELLDADVVALFSRQPDGTFRLEPARGSRTGDRAGPAGRDRRRAIAPASRASAGGRRLAARVPGRTTGRTAPHAAMALPIEVGDEVAAPC